MTGWSILVKLVADDVCSALSKSLTEAFDSKFVFLDLSKGNPDGKGLTAKTDTTEGLAGILPV